MHNALIATTNSPGLFEALGINWKLLVEQAIAFLILVGILGKFVYPALMKSIDDRREQIEAGLKEAKESQEVLEKAETKVAELLEGARKDADEILARTHQEAASVVADAEEKAKTRAEQIVADARQQLSVDIAKAREQLKKDTVELVGLATERIIGEKLDDRKDADLVKKALAQGESAR
ncbi:MAG TPA: F0F1 ATP synthase subunit B [Patescibacteria group bacterium]|nr:F0F1 ATP synthase subunit B [Patescibacteria group bacterium]HSW99430.1 F0F1 ATP synthase subunit B [Patescibacteria group bacterium]